MRKCTKCQLERSEVDFYNDAYPWCRDCKRASVRGRRKVNWEKEKIVRSKWRRANRDTYNARNKKQREELRALVLQGYGGRCACCGETETVFLTLDHVYEDGARERQEMQQHALYWKAKRLGFPSEYQVLCFNCNWAKHRGGCPHGSPAGQLREKSLS